MYEKLYQPRKIIAFEPEHNNYKLLLKTINKNNLKKVIPENLGIGEESGKLKFSSKSLNSYIINNGDQEINIITIDDYMLRHNLDIGLIKLDVEGFELEVLKGAVNCIKKNRPVLLISIYHNGREVFETINFINKLNPNYRCIIRRLNPLTPIFELVLIYWDEG